MLDLALDALGAGAVHLPLELGDLRLQLLDSQRGDDEPVPRRDQLGVRARQLGILRHDEPLQLCNFVGKLIRREPHAPLSIYFARVSRRVRSSRKRMISQLPRQRRCPCALWRPPLQPFEQHRYLPRSVPDADLALMRRLDRLHRVFFAGSRMLRGLLATEGSKVGRRHLKTLIQRMGIEALHRRPRTTKPEPGDKLYPYLMCDMQITRRNQVWAMEMTYTLMARGFVYCSLARPTLHLSARKSSDNRDHLRTTN